MRKACFLFITLFCWSILSAQPHTQHQKDSLAKGSMQNAKANALSVISLSEIGAEIPEDIKSHKSHITLVHASQLDDAAFVKYEGSLYTIAWNEKQRVSFISTSDSNFKTDNVSLNTDYKTFRKLFPGKMNRLLRVGYFYKLPSQWNAGFCAGTACSSSELKDDDKIAYFFKWLY